MRRGIPSFIALFAVVVVAFAAAPALGPSPHGARSDSCAGCHGKTADGALDPASFVSGAADAACLSCHEVGHHEVGIIPVRVDVPPDLPVDDGKLACHTCHDEPACDGQEIQADNRYFFRGGPYEQVGQLCARCHQKTRDERFNPHVAMAAGERNEICLYCHLDRPETGAALELKIDGPDICKSCHVDAPHAGAAAHYGATLTKGMIASATKAHLPLRGEQMECLTCHDPHPASAGVSFRDHTAEIGASFLPVDWVDHVLAPAIESRAPGVARAITTEPDFLRLPLRKGELCQACHDGAQVEQARQEERP